MQMTKKINSNVQSVCLSTMRTSYLQHLLIFSLILCHRDSADIVVELLIKCAAAEPVSIHLLEEGLGLSRISKSRGI